VGVSRIRVTIDRLVLNGLESAAQKPLVAALQSELALVLSVQSMHAEWAQSHRNPVLKLGRMPLQPGASGGRALGKKLARTIGRGLKP